MVRLLVAVVMLAAAAGAARAQEVVGRATVIDGDTLEVAGQRFRLFGIDAPELGQSCPLRDRMIDCGLVASTQLSDLTAAATVTCEAVERRADGVVIANCTSDGFNISENMVYTGWARADERVSRRYSGAQARSQRARRGLWAGEFPPPWDWRRDNGRPAADH